MNNNTTLPDYNTPPYSIKQKNEQECIENSNIDLSYYNSLIHYKVGKAVLDVIKTYLVQMNNTVDCEVYTITNKLQDNIYIKLIDDTIFYFKIFKHLNNIGKEILRIESFLTNQKDRKVQKIGYIDIDYNSPDFNKINFYIMSILCLK